MRKKANNAFMTMNQKGSYTVEASLVMGLVLSLLVAVIYLCFYIHDRGFLQAAAQEAACAAALHAGDQTKPAKKTAQTLINGKMLGSRGVAAAVTETGKSVCVRYQGTFPIPQLVRVFYPSGSIPMEASVTLTTRAPSRTIQMIRGAAKIVNRIRGE